MIHCLQHSGNHGICALLGMIIVKSAFCSEPGPSDSITSVEEYLKYFSSITVASKTEESISDAPGVLFVITAEEIKQFGGVTLADAIQRAPSIQFLGSHLYPENEMIMRGDLQSHYDNHMLILINGRPFRDDIAGGQNAILYKTFPLNVVERLEFIRGPGSVLYGTNAFDGVINIITKKPDKETDADITAGAGSFNGMAGHAQVGYKKRDLDIIGNVNFFHDDGWDFRASTVLPPATTETTGSMKYYTHDISGSFFLNYMGFSLSAFHADMRRGNLGLSPAWEMGGDGHSWMEDNRTFIDAGYSSRVMSKYTINSNVTFNYCTFEEHTLPTWSTENSYSTLGEVSFGGPLTNRMNFIVGAAAIDRWNEGVTGARIPAENDFYYYAYTQLDYAPIDKIKFFTGAQFNKAPSIDGIIVPRIGATVHATDFLGAKVNYAEAFRSPMPLEMTTNFPGVIIGNPLLKPEMVHTSDFQIFYFMKTFQSFFSLFRSYYSDLIGRIPHPTVANTNTYGNTGTLDIRGLEAEGKFSLNSRLSLEASATYQKEINEKTLTPNYLAKGGVSYAAPFGLTVGIFNNYYGFPKQNSEGKAVNPEAKAVHVVSINMNYCLPFYKHVQVNLFIQNALNQAYFYPEFNKKWINTLPLEPGRALYGMISYMF
jgi:outer membrane receptor for ferrienterochelin and colicins